MSNDNDSYDSILNRSFDDIPENDPLLPDCKAILKIRNATFMAPKGDTGKGAKVLVYFSPTEVLEGADEEEVAAAIGDTELSDVEVSSQFWADRNRDWRQIKAFLATAGVDISSGKAIIDLLKDASGRSVVGDVRTRSYVNGMGVDVTSNEAGNFEALE